MDDSGVTRAAAQIAGNGFSDFVVVDTPSDVEASATRLELLLVTRVLAVQVDIGVVAVDQLPSRPARGPFLNFGNDFEFVKNISIKIISLFSPKKVQVFYEKKRKLF